MLNSKLSYVTIRVFFITLGQEISGRAELCSSSASEPRVVSTSASVSTAGVGKEKNMARMCGGAGFLPLRNDEAVTLCALACKEHVNVTVL